MFFMRFSKDAAADEYYILLEVLWNNVDPLSIDQPWWKKLYELSSQADFPASPNQQFSIKSIVYALNVLKLLNLI